MDGKKTYSGNGARRLKVYGKHFPVTYGGYKLYPEIRLLGKWLQDCGFKCGDEIQVTAEDSKITITIVSEPKGE